MKNLLYILFSVFIIACCAGCEKKCSQLNVCSAGIGYDPGRGRGPTIIGYYGADVDTQIIISYKPNGAFDHPVDSSVYIYDYSYNKTDTQYLSLRFSGGAPGTQRVNDFKLILPGVRTYYFTEVIAGGNYTQNEEFTCSHGATGCSRGVLSMKIDGVYQKVSDSGGLTLYK